MEENISGKHKTIAYTDFTDYIQTRKFEKIEANNLSQTSRDIYQMLTACYVSKLKWHHPYPINSVCCARLIRIRDRAGSQKKVLTCILHFPSLFFRLIVICSDAPIHQNISFHSSVYYLGTVESQTMTSAYRLFLMKNNLHRF